MDEFKTLLTYIIPLIIITDPLGNLPLFLLFTQNNTKTERERMALIASGAACAILFFFTLTGDFILRFFGITLPSFQIAGGFIFFIYSLQMMGLIPSGIKTSEEEELEGVKKENIALVPLATPLLAGPGAITAVLVWRQAAETMMSIGFILIAIAATCLVVHLFFRYGPQVSQYLGVGGIRVLTRLMGLLLAVIAVQFMVSGLRQVFHG